MHEFSIQVVIGHGHSGIIYRAAHNELDLTVAIKESLLLELSVREGVTVQPRSGTDTVGRDFKESQSHAEFLVRREAEVHPFTEADLLAVMLPLLAGLVGVRAAGVLHRGTNHRIP